MHIACSGRQCADGNAKRTDDTRRILVVNTGSSTVKFALLKSEADNFRELWRMEYDWNPDESAACLLHKALAECRSPIDIFGHRVVHGGTKFVEPVKLTDHVVQQLEPLQSLAPLHNGPAFAVIREQRRIYPDKPGAVVFDTAFHADRPAESMQYALPTGLAAKFEFRRYGFHGLAHESLVNSLTTAQRVPSADVAAVTLQLGAGCSACAVRAGRSIETSMGYTPLEGLVMGSRCGDIDPAIVLRLMRAGFSADRIETELTRHSGLFALSGTADMRKILAAAARGQKDAELAIRIFCHRIILACGAYFTLLGGEGALVFGGGIGGNSPAIREQIARGLTAWDIGLDTHRNQANEPGRISVAGSRPVFAFQSNEEFVIAHAVAELLESKSGPHRVSDLP